MLQAVHFLLGEVRAVLDPLLCVLVRCTDMTRKIWQEAEGRLRGGVWGWGGGLGGWGAGGGSESEGTSERYERLSEEEGR